VQHSKWALDQILKVQVSSTLDVIFVLKIADLERQTNNS